MNGKVPNVVLCLCDQLRPFEVGCYGNTTIRTPHIDRLAAEGVRVEVACSNNPVCTPARSILLSGQYSRTCTGALGNEAGTPPCPERQRLCNPTIADVFKTAGYETALLGKWHVHPHPNVAGFDYALFPQCMHRYTRQVYYENDGPGFEVTEFGPDFEREHLRTFLSQSRSQPFFLYYNISQPHMPLADAPAHYTGMYHRDEVPLRPNVWRDGRMAHDENWFKIYLANFEYFKDGAPTDKKLPGGFDLRDLAALYYGLTTCTDDQVGALLTMLEEQGLAENTIVLFVSDHGDMLGSHCLFNKDLLYEEAIRVPMIWRYPKHLSPRVVDDQVVSLVDVMPSLLGLADLPIPESVQGRDRSACLRGDTETGDNHASIETFFGSIGVRTPTHLYGLQVGKRDTRRTLPPKDDSAELFFDMTQDPYQLHNLAGTGEQQALAADLRERLVAWHRDTPWLKLGAT